MIKYRAEVEQITKADRAEKANPAPRYGGLVPPFHDLVISNVK